MENLDCLCHNAYINDKTIECTQCHQLSHEFCYNPESSPLVYADFICIKCRIRIQEPGLALHSILHYQFILPSRGPIYHTMSLPLEEKPPELELILFGFYLRLENNNHNLVAWPGKKLEGTWVIPELKLNDQALPYGGNTFIFLEDPQYPTESQIKWNAINQLTV